MINYTTRKLLHNDKIMNNSETRNQNKLPLLGKGVLLIGNDTVVLQNLVLQLAQKGADIAVLCWKIPLETARWLRDQVQSFGRRLFLVERAKNQGASVEQLVHRVTTEWGHFDIFIDVSAKRSKSAPASNGQAQDGHRRPGTPVWRPDQWHLTQVVLEEMARD
ncbi:MAG: hypothetical protein IPM53_10585 [Anaerolineaceae bacterium]|nr:hypothetical protein [Anaerolineaceae bacterium]